MPLETKRWDEPRRATDGFRLLICRYRPRALAKAKETWDLWWPDLGPSKDLHAAIYGKDKDSTAKTVKVEPIPWDVFRTRYFLEMRAEGPREMITILAEKVLAGQMITLLCSAACTDPARCHRTLTRELIEARMAEISTAAAEAAAAAPVAVPAES